VIKKPSTMQVDAIIAAVNVCGYRYGKVRTINAGQSLFFHVLFDNFVSKIYYEIGIKVVL
jgi:hypothetical protein